jgi:hypothetical protein
MALNPDAGWQLVRRQSGRCTPNREFHLTLLFTFGADVAILPLLKSTLYGMPGGGLTAVCAGGGYGILC